jgi:hypothetical protein
MLGLVDIWDSALRQGRKMMRKDPYRSGRMRATILLKLQNIVISRMVSLELAQY